MVCMWPVSVVNVWPASATAASATAASATAASATAAPGQPHCSLYGGFSLGGKFVGSSQCVALIVIIVVFVVVFRICLHLFAGPCAKTPSLRQIVRLDDSGLGGLEKTLD